MGIEGYYEDYFDERQEKEKLTNFQKIKNMSLDEMAEFIKRLKTTYCRYKELNFNCVGCIIENLCDLPLSKTKQWLQEESEQ